MSSYFILYLCSIASALDELFNLIACLSAVGLAIYAFATFLYSLDADCDFLDLIKKPFKWVIPIGLLSGLLGALIPSTKECYAIFGVGATLEYVQSNKELKKIPDNAFKAINYYLESIPNDSIK